MEANPYVYIVPLSGMDGSDITKGILEENPKPDYEGEFNVYQWNINNKYYVTDVKLCIVEDITKCPIEMNNAAEAVIGYFDPKQANVLSDINALGRVVLEDTNADVKILAYKTCQDFVTLTKDEVLNWCIGNGWELVELEPEIEVGDEDLEDDFVDSFGFQRMTEALNANMWSNLKMKDTESTNATGILNNYDINDDDNPACHPLTDEESWGDNADLLLCNLMEMKATAASLPFDERKEYAAKIATQFMKAFGDDDDSDVAEL